MEEPEVLDRSLVFKLTQAFGKSELLVICLLLVTFVLIATYTLRTKNKESLQTGKRIIYAILPIIFFYGIFCLLGDIKKTIEGIPLVGMAPYGEGEFIRMQTERTVFGLRVISGLMITLFVSLIPIQLRKIG